jgi:hypothetical protein
VEVFTQPDRPASEFNHCILLTEVLDSQGHTLTYTCHNSLRVVAFTGAIGQVTAIEYLP